MSKRTAYCLLISAGSFFMLLSIFSPCTLSDSNKFLNSFVNHELLSFLGVMVTITLGSAANLHFELNQLEERYKKRVFASTRKEVKQAALSMIFMLVFAILLVVIKPLLNYGDTVVSVLNGTALLIIFANVLTLTDITMAAFKLKPKFD